MEFVSEIENTSMESSLPADMYFEILSRASLETVERSKAVSKELRQISFEPTFLPSHCSRTKSLFGYYFQTITRNKYQSVFVSDIHHGGAASIKHDDMQILASSSTHGILCCQKHVYKKNRYYIGKPATNQWQPLPNPKLRFETEAVALVVVKSDPLLYSIVRLSRPKLKHNHICEIFDSETWTWEMTESPNLPYGDFILPRQSAVSVGKSAYWLTHEDNVLTFDRTEKTFECFLLPEQCNGYSQKQLLKYEDGLGLSCMADDGRMMEVWAVQARRWTRKMAVDVKLLEGLFDYPRLLGFCGSSDVAFVKTANGAVVYNFRDGSFREISVPYHINRDVHNIFMFRSDFETVDLSRGRMKKLIRSQRSPASGDHASKIFKNLFMISPRFIGIFLPILLFSFVSNFL